MTKNNILDINKFRKVGLNRHCQQSKDIAEATFQQDSKEYDADLKIWQTITAKLKKLRFLLLTMQLFIENKTRTENSSDVGDWKLLTEELRAQDKLLIELCFANWENAKQRDRMLKKQFVNSLIEQIASIDMADEVSLKDLNKKLKAAIDNTWHMEDALVTNRLEPITYIKRRNSIADNNRRASYFNGGLRYIHECSKYIRKNIKPNTKKTISPIHLVE